MHQVDLTGTVTSKPRFFYGTRTHAMHEAFTFVSDAGEKLEIIDNVKLAPEIPVLPGDRIRVVGEQIDDARGGPIVHWTHHDPAHRHPDGFIELHGVRYGRTLVA